MIYTLTLNPAIDYVMQLPGKILPGTIHRAAEEAYQFGGKGINVSTVLCALEVPSVALGFVAGFTGRALEQGLQEAGIPTRFLHLETGMTRINVKVKGQAETELNGRGPAIGQKDMARLYVQLDMLQAGDILVLSGSVPGTLPPDTYSTILAHLTGRDICAVVDTAGEGLLRTLPYRPFLIKPNRQELEELFSRPLTDEDCLRDCCRQLQAQGARNVLVSLGAEGALLLDETGAFHPADCPKGTVVNSVGAGDSMVAGFLAGWIQTGSYRHALHLGTAAGSATAFSLGLATKPQILALLKKTERTG